MTSNPCVTTLAKWPTPTWNETDIKFASRNTENIQNPGSDANSKFSECQTSIIVGNIQIALSSTASSLPNEDLSGNNRVRAIYPAVFPLKPSVIVVQPLMNEPWQSVPSVFAPRNFPPLHSNTKLPFTGPPTQNSNYVQTYESSAVNTIASTSSTWSSQLGRQPITYPGNAFWPSVQIQNKSAVVKQCSILNVLGGTTQTSKKQRKKKEKEPYYKKVPLLNRKPKNTKLGKKAGKDDKKSKNSIILKRPGGITAYVDSVILQKKPAILLQSQPEHFECVLPGEIDINANHSSCMQTGKQYEVILDISEKKGANENDTDTAINAGFDEELTVMAEVNPTVMYELVSMEKKVLDFSELDSVLDFQSAQPRHYEDWFNTVNPQAIIPPTI